MGVGQFTPLYYVCSLAGFCMILGGVWLIYREKIYLNSETKEVMEVQLPLFGKIKTNIPALGLFLIGFFPLIYPIYKSRPQYVTVSQPSVKSSIHPVDVYVVVHEEKLDQDDQLTIEVPVLSTEDYSPHLIYVVGGEVFHQKLDLTLVKSGILSLKSKDIQVQNPKSATALLQPDIQPKPVNFK